MNELLQKHGCANVFTIPEGLKELMSDISREVLREQPVKIYDFIANYLSVLLITREHGILAVRVMDDLCDCRPSVTDHLKEIGLTDDEAVTIAEIIKQEVEGFEPTEGKETVKEAQIVKRILTRSVLDEVKVAKVCQIARNAYRDYWYRKKLLQQRLKVAPEEPWEIAAERTLQIYKTTKPSFTELTRATQKIQAAYRGYHVRRNILRHLKPKKKRGPKVDRLGPPLDIAASREIDLGPFVDIKVREDDISVMFDLHATEQLGLPYDPQKAITHVEGVDPEKPATSAGRSTQLVELKSIKSLLAPTAIPSSEAIMEHRRSDRRQSRLPSQIPATPKQSRLPSQLQLSFAEAPAEVIPDATEVTQGVEVKEITTQDGETLEAIEVPEDIPDDRTEGDGESAPTSTVPTSAPETDATDVEDIAEDMVTSGDEGE